MQCTGKAGFVLDYFFSLGVMPLGEKGKFCVLRLSYTLLFSVPINQSTEKGDYPALPDSTNVVWGLIPLMLFFVCSRPVAVSDRG